MDQIIKYFQAYLIEYDKWIGYFCQTCSHETKRLLQSKQKWWHRDHVKCIFLDANLLMRQFNVLWHLSGRGNVNVTWIFFSLDKREGERAEGLNDRDWQTENSRERARRVCFIFVCVSRQPFWDLDHNKAHQIKLRPFHWVKVASHWE